ncbi:MAG: NAD(P)H-hydrate dehydratase [Parvularculaceae bacterium]|nr:NAD(P)H-hydrate dehydratase [Parvularculaceae bacterium]
MSQHTPPFILLDAAETREVERAAIDGGLSGAAMMEAAGEAVASFIMRSLPPRPAVVLCGPGNNGGDGFVVARKLKEAGWPVSVCSLAPVAELKGDAALMASLWTDEIAPATPSSLNAAGVIVDALFGTGLARDIDGSAAALIDAANASDAPSIAVDMPSGVNADTGVVMGTAMKASATVTFIARKPGHVLFPGRAYCGSMQLADIGVDGGLVARQQPKTYENHPGLWGAYWPRPTAQSHKYSRGHAGIVSGPRARTGAARLAARGALRAGAGLVTVFSPPDAVDENAAHLTAIMLREVDGAWALGEALSDSRFTAALIGPGAGTGAGTGDGTKDCVLKILKSTAAAVLDADALTVFAGQAGALFAALRDEDILTPHAGEFAKVFTDIGLAAGRLTAARAAAKAAGAVVVLKGADTIIAGPDGRAAINSNAPADLATAGAGDVLAGFIAGLRAQKMPGFEAAAAGVWLHGACGQAAGPGLIAEDLPEILPQVLRSLLTPPKQKAEGA